jgi:hypothetical protein
MSRAMSPIPQDATDNYALIWEAIERKQQVLAIYQGYYRELCPHSIGINKHGERQGLFYQFGGESRSGLGPPGSPDNWRCIRIDELSDIRLRDGEWHTAPHHTRPQMCVFHRVDLSIFP